MLATPTFTVERLGAALGAEIHGVNLRQPVSADLKEALRAALDQHQVIGFRGQGVMSAEEHLAAASIWGFPHVPEPYRTVALLDGAECPIERIAITQKRTPEAPPFTDQWHMDVTYSPDPPTIGTICAELIPKVGGDTAFVSLHAIYEALSEPMKAMLDDLQGEHTMAPQISEGFNIDARMIKLFPNHLHPLVLRHPRTGRKLAYISAEDTWMKRIVGLKKGEGAAVLGYLRRQLDNLEHQFRWRWAQGDFVVWDQRAVNHLGMSDHFALDPYRTVRSAWCYANNEPAVREAT